MLEVVFLGFLVYELVDGVWIINCYLCNKIVCLCDMDVYLKYYELDKIKCDFLLICWNINCGWMLYGVGVNG